MSDIQQNLFSAEEMKQAENSNLNHQQGPVTCLDKEFENDEARRAYFREELRKKLPELRKIEGFPIGEDDDIINLSDPPYYTACPNPWLNDFIAEWEKEKVQLEADGRRTADFEVKEPYASDVSEGKYNPLYLLHPYLTKVPYPAIIKYLNHYTQPGDIVLDGFAGTGMTGAAARLCETGKRRAICIDLSPLATFISSFVNSDISNQVFSKITLSMIEEAKRELGWMLETKHSSNIIGEINYVIWSNVYACPICGSEIVFYDEAFDTSTGDVHEKFSCPKCYAELSKSKCKVVTNTTNDILVDDVVTTPKRVPVLIGYSVNGKRYQKRPDSHDLEIIDKISSYCIPYWAPTDKIINGDEISRASRDGIKYFEQYYTKRTLAILSKLKSLVPHPIFNSLITKVSFQSTIMYRYCTKGGGPMSGTMYVPALIKEVNVFNQLEAFIKDRAKVAIASNLNNVITCTQSSTTICNLADNSVDYIFTDPPFGKNLMYSELNYISEMWLKVKTENQRECVENKSQQKDVYFYQKLIQKVFSEYYRILKPKKWLSVEFSNTSAAIWNSIQNAITSTGFIIANVSALDKKKDTYKAVTTTTAVKQDLVITCYKPSNELTEMLTIANSKKDSVWDFMSEHLSHLPVHIERGNATTSVVERSPKILYDRLISYYVQHGYQIPMDAQEFQAGLHERFIERDGMYFTAPQAAEYEEKRKHTSEFVPMGLIVSDEANGIEWLKLQLREPKTYQEISPEWMQAVNGLKKGDVLPELKDILEENFIEDETGHWHVPDLEKQIDLEKLKHKSLMKEFNLYREMAQKPRARIKEVRVEALREGFKQCFKDKDFATILLLGDKIPQNILTEDEVLLQYYDIAQMRS